MAEKNKNQTATERALAAERSSGRLCTKCGQEVRLKDLVNVQKIAFSSNKKAIVSFHRACYTV